MRREIGCDGEGRDVWMMAQTYRRGWTRDRSVEEGAESMGEGARVWEKVWRARIRVRMRARARRAWLIVSR